MNKVVLVTGGMGGIGTAICRDQATRGAHVIASYHQGGEQQNAEAWQKKQDYPVSIYYVDVCDFASCAKMVSQIESDFGQINVLVNNAGITSDVQLCKMDVDCWQSVLHTNLDSVFNVTRNVITGMIERKYGRVINISSINGQKGQFGQTNYSAAKAGMHGFTKALAQEVARKGITVNTISPGYAETKMVMSLPEDVRQKIIDQIPVGRLGKPEEIASAVAFLAAESSGFITGSNLVINGGHYML